MIIGTEGGIIGPITAAVTVSAEAKGLSYPSFSIAGTSTEPRPAVSATASPVIPAKIMQAMTFTMAKPPLICPTTALQSLTMR